MQEKNPGDEVVREAKSHGFERTVPIDIFISKLKDSSRDRIAKMQELKSSEMREMMCSVSDCFEEA